MTLTLLIVTFGSLTLLTGSVIVVDPEAIFGFLRNHLGKLGIHILAVAVRLILGALLIYQSNLSRYPLVIEIIGWLSIAAAMVFALMGRRNFCRSMTWALSRSKSCGRIGGILAVTFGGFLVLAFV